MRVLDLAFCLHNDCRNFCAICKYRYRKYKNVLPWRSVVMLHCEFVQLNVVEGGLKQWDGELSSSDVFEHVLIGFCTDERALVEGARQLGFVFSIRTPQDVTVSTVNILDVMKFGVAIVAILMLLALVETSGGIA